jgi:hypothetical protein
MYVFGGRTPADVYVNDLWQFNGSAWTELTANGAAGSPPVRAMAAIAWDHNNDQLVVFGGYDGTNSLGDTWTWDTTSGWTQKFPTNSPQPLAYSQAAYDDFNDNVLLFGGQSSSGADQSETWSWDGTDWTLLSPATVPPARRQHGMAARMDLNDIVMCCGQSGSTKLSDTFIWNGIDWSLIGTTTAPQTRVAMDMTYDAARQRVVISGGNNSSGNPVGSIAEFDGTDWANLPKDPVLLKRTRYFLAFVPTLGRSYLFGGQKVASPPPTGTFEYFDPTIGPGTAYCFGNTSSGNTCPCGNDNDQSNPLGAGCAHGSSAAGARLSASGTASISNDTLVLAGWNAQPNNSSMFFQANNGLNGSTFLGDGIRCAGGGLIRLKVKTNDANGNASSSPMVVTTRSATFGHVIAPGETLYYQWWFRDTADSPCATDNNTSNGYEITWAP